MPDQFTTRLRLTDMANGEHGTTWGDVADKNFDLLEQAIAGVVSVNCAGALNITLTAVNGGDDQSRAPVLVLTGVLTGSIAVIVPSVEMERTVYNNTTGAFTLTVKTAAGAGVLVPQGRKMDLICNAVDVVAGADSFLSLDVAGALTVRGATNESLATPVASAATTNIWATDGNTVHVTGSTGPITSLGTAPRAGAQRTVVFDSTPTLTNGANLVLPTLTDIAVRAGDSMEVLADTTTKAIVLDYMRADGSALTIPPIIAAPRTIQSTADGTLEAVAWDLDRASPTPDNADYLMALRWLMRSDAATARVAAELLARILAVGNGVEDGELSAWTMRAGTLTQNFIFGKGGVYTPAATGGDKGADSGNFGSLYAGGVAVPRQGYSLQSASASLGAGDRGGMVVFSNPGAVCSGTAALGAGYRSEILNGSSGDLTLDFTAAQTIDGLATRIMRPQNRVEVYTDGSNWFTLHGAYTFTSAELAVDNASATVVAHGLGQIPNHVRGVLRYKGAGELGYVAGDEIPIGGDYGDQASSASGVELVADATNITLLQATIQVKALNKTTPATAVVLTTADWKFELQAAVRYG